MTRVLMALAGAAVIMCRGGVNRVPLIDQEHCVVGILTRDDVVAAVAWPGTGWGSLPVQHVSDGEAICLVTSSARGGGEPGP